MAWLQMMNIRPCFIISIWSVESGWGVGGQ
jgi:hypothetical protein